MANWLEVYWADAAEKVIFNTCDENGKRWQFERSVGELFDGPREELVLAFKHFVEGEKIWRDHRKYQAEFQRQIDPHIVGWIAQALAFATGCTDEYQLDMYSRRALEPLISSVDYDRRQAERVATQETPDAI